MEYDKLVENVNEFWEMIHSSSDPVTYARRAMKAPMSFVKAFEDRVNLAVTSGGTGISHTAARKITTRLLKKFQPTDFVFPPRDFQSGFQERVKAERKKEATRLAKKQKRKAQRRVSRKKPRVKPEKTKTEVPAKLVGPARSGHRGCGGNHPGSKV